jgi:hypothetical protein
MSRRNFILLVIVLAILMVSVVVFLFSRRAPTGENTDGENFPANLNPFGGIQNVPNKNTPSSGGEGEGTAPTEGEVEKMQLAKVSSMPIAGYSVFKKERVAKEFFPAVRYVDRATGYIYQTFADDIKETKFSNTLIPKVHEAFFGNLGQTVIMRYLKVDEETIQTFVSNLPKEVAGEESTGNFEIKGTTLPENITDISLSPDTTKIFYLLGSGDSATGVIYGLRDNKKTQVFDSPFTEWLSLWPNSKMITLSTKPSGNVGGHIYTINPDKKGFRRIFGDIVGLTTLTSKDGKLILYSGSSLLLNIYNVDTKESTPLGVSTLPDKCVWGENNILYCAVPKSINPALYPDSWYKGEVSFQDEIWKIDAENNNTVRIINPVASGGEETDGIRLSLDEKEDYLFFVNKKDSYLWELRLK